MNLILKGNICYGKSRKELASFEDGYEFDAVIIDDIPLALPGPLQLRERLAKIVYLSGEQHIRAKYVRGRKV